MKHSWYLFKWFNLICVLIQCALTILKSEFYISLKNCYYTNKNYFWLYKSGYYSRYSFICMFLFATALIIFLAWPHWNIQKLLGLFLEKFKIVFDIWFKLFLCSNCLTVSHAYIVCPGGGLEYADCREVKKTKQTLPRKGGGYSKYDTKLHLESGIFLYCHYCHVHSDLLVLSIGQRDQLENYWYWIRMLVTI